MSTPPILHYKKPSFRFQWLPLPENYFIILISPNMGTREHTKTLFISNIRR
ncbi:hypothetical protein RUMHYD_01547 [Blautia hydrogenotrophica DSM 10507]|uniref:Uncharacterized protein n=1 Tax=Blautia hydrogenotrophica (strain DSM 10507 / JCM 14656 / S5a33) TaxID=476272 RepID=C0CL26_BLAHS|nr:hypothetical protein RUMHYD_01547 [Blautia hydrogenotrophica DSM 10507]